MKPASDRDPELIVRPSAAGDLLELVDLSRRIWGAVEGWKAPELLHHQQVFTEGQLVAVDRHRGRVIGMAVSLVLRAADWPIEASWDELTAYGSLDSHDPAGDLLYAAGVAVHPTARRRGVGSRLYQARMELVRRRGLTAIRAGARIPGYRRVADRMSPEAYVDEVVRGLRTDPTLSFQLARGFRVVGVARRYLEADVESRGAAAIIEKSAPDEAPTD